MDLAAALAYLDEHVNLEKMAAGRADAPTLERMQRLMAVLGDPQHAMPVVHITGTNGKGSVTAITSALLAAQGLSVGTYTSPHLERLNERIARNGEPIADEELAEQIAAVAAVEPLAGVRPSYFEIVTAAAFRWFADVAVDVAVVEVGLLGRWDATNVADGRVGVVTNIGLDHTEYAGPTTAHIAREKAGIVKPGSTLVLGETDPELVAIFRAAGAEQVWEREHDFGADDNELALGGRLLTLRTPYGSHGHCYLPLHGRHQGDNAAAALTAVESFFGGALDDSVVAEGLASVRMPGRFEVVGHQPLVILDGAHNPAGADVVAGVMADDFAPAGRTILVVGFLQPRDPLAMLEALRVEDADLVVCTTPPSPRAVPAALTARAALEAGADDVVAVDDVGRALDLALGRAGADDAVLVTGSLYLVGAARPRLRHRLPG